MKFVATKTADPLDLQALHRVRERLVSQRTGVINQIRAFRWSVALPCGRGNASCALSYRAYWPLHPMSARALISMMAGSTCFNQRPDTLMQDRIRQIDEITLRRTAGPYIGSNAVIRCSEHFR
jgi:transposase